MLPAFCVQCGETGTRQRELGRAPGRGIKLSRSAFLCDQCDEQARRISTRAFACRAALAVALCSLAAALLFWSGEANFLGQACAVILLGAGATALLEWWLAAGRPKASTFQPLSSYGDGYLFLPDSAGGRLIARSLEPRSVAQAQELPLSIRPSMLTPLGLALTLLVATHMTLDATLLIIDKDGDGAVLVDSTLVARPQSLSSEAAGRLAKVRVFAGSRRLTWIAKDGSVRLDETISIKPSEVVLLGTPPDGLCPFVESQRYGVAGEEPQLRSLGAGPVYRMEPAPEYIFTQIPPPESAQSRGGSMTALRLLPCRE